MYLTLKPKELKPLIYGSEANEFSVHSDSSISPKLVHIKKENLFDSLNLE